MAAGLIKTAGDLMGSTGVDHLVWCEQLLNFCCEDEQDRERSREGYCFAWSNCFAFLRRHLPADIDHGLHLLFEYVLPLHGGRRADVVLLTSTQVVVLEFKATRKHQEADRLQAEGYVHYFKTSHAATLQHGLTVRGYVVRTRNAGGHAAAAGVLDDSNFKETIRELLTGAEPATAELLEEWQGSRSIYNPYTLAQIDKLVREGARAEFKYLLDDGDISRSLATIERLIKVAKANGQKLVIMVDGTPGSGKTYLGMKVAFEHKADHPPAVYVSGNAPLIKFLRHVFSPTNSKDRASDAEFIKDMYALKQSDRPQRDYKGNLGYATPMHGIIVFDEAQRAWNQEQMRRGDNLSEVEWLLQLGNKIMAAHGFCVLLCLIGTGQAIYVGEETDLKLWREAMGKYQDWYYYVSPAVAVQLPSGPLLSTDATLHLSTAMRSNFVDVSAWARAVIDNHSLEEQQRLYEAAATRGFEIRLLRRWGQLKSTRPIHAQETYGLLLSSMARHERKAEVTRDETGSWFIDGGCRQLDKYATEFVYQGLELDWPIVIFGGDFYLKDGQWVQDIPAWSRQKLKDPEQIQRNIYYVLLTRGRRGLILFIPEGREFDETYAHFLQMGIQEVPPQQIWAMVQ